jgi:PKD repeat protein
VWHVKIFQRVLVSLATLAALTGLGLLAPTGAQAATADIGYPDQYYGTEAGTDSPTADKPENKAWIAHGSWWADLWDSGSSSHRIFRLDKATHNWVDTGVALDNRASTQSDTFFDGTHLFVSSHVIASANNKAVSGKPTRLYRYSWIGSEWVRDAGFPIEIQAYSTESFTIDIDAAGVIWATWTRSGKVYVTASTTSGDNSTISFLKPWILSAPGANSTVAADDISAVVSYYGGRMMIVWSNQTHESLYYAVHANGAPVTEWTGGVASTGPLMADDHVNLKSLQSDSEGRVFAAVKTSRNDASDGKPSDPLIELLTFKPLQGTWSAVTFGTVADSHTRPIVVIDEENQSLHVFATGPSTEGTVAFKGTIYEKTSPLDHPAFAPGLGVPVIRDISSASMNNASSTRQPVNSTTGLVVLASNASTKRYWHMEEALSSANVEPPVASFTTSAGSGTAPLQVKFTDTSTKSPTAWSWDFGDGSTSNQQSPTHTFTEAGHYSVSLSVQNAAGSSNATTTVTVTVTAPTASFDATRTTGTAPLDVTFADTSTDGPTSWSWDFGDGTTSAKQSPTHTFTAAGDYKVTLTATNAGGSSTAIRHIVVVESPSVLYRVNAGGAQLSGSPVWKSDTSDSPSVHTNAAASYSTTYSTTKVIDLTNPSVPSGTPEALFQTHRYDVSKGQPMKWSFDVADGAYRVRLYFAESWSTNYVVGGRVFTVRAEGTDAVTNLDVWSAVGPKTGLVKEVAVQVSDGTLNLDFVPVKDNPMVSAIEILPA